MRLIDADKLKPKLECINRAECQIFGNTAWRFAAKCIDIVESAPTIKLEQQWIPVSTPPEEPKENPIFEGKKVELYLVVYNHGDYPFRAFWDGKDFIDGFSKVYPDYWMPLPKL